MSHLVEFLKRQLFEGKVYRKLLPRAELNKEDVGLVLNQAGETKCRHLGLYSANSVNVEP